MEKPNLSQLLIGKKDRFEISLKQTSSGFIPKSSGFIKDEKLKKPPLKNNDLFTKIKDPIPRKDEGSGSEPELEQ